jgi:hypothetical protein
MATLDERIKMYETWGTYDYPKMLFAKQEAKLEMVLSAVRELSGADTVRALEARPDVQLLKQRVRFLLFD